MNFNYYQELARRTAAGHDNPAFRRAILALGLAGETGEAVELVKKAIGHGHDMNRAILAKELGDVLWYIAVLAAEYDLDLNTIGTLNIEKLQRRYPEGFSSEASRSRVE